MIESTQRAIARLFGYTEWPTNTLLAREGDRSGEVFIVINGRIDALNYTMAHDDGQGDDYEAADIVLLGVSRTSKTPTSVYLAHRGYRAANIPLVKDVPLPEAIFKLRNPLVVGLTASPERIVQIRRNRLLSLNEASQTAYAEHERVEEEIRFARRMFADNNWPVIDVTRRSIEETAAAIMAVLREKEGEEPAL